LTFAGRIYDWFENDAFSWQDVLAVLQQHPEWREINRHVEQKVV
jgi:spore coat polysaccharide biosynthesis protein SpsF